MDKLDEILTSIVAKEHPWFDPEKAVAEAKAEILKHYVSKEEVREALPEKRTIPADSRYANDPFGYTKDKGFNSAIDQIRERLKL